MPVSSQRTPVPGQERGRATVDFAIAGGGIIGLTTALALHDAGASVAVFERAPGPGHESSGAAGGILSMLYPWEQPGPLEHLVQHSRACWPGHCARVTRETGLDTGFNRCGLVSYDVDGLDAAREWSSRRGEPLRVLDAAAVSERVPAADPAPAIELPGVAMLHPRRTLDALAHTLHAHGVPVYWSTPVSALTVEDRRVTGVRTDDGVVHRAGAVVVATGAWSPDLLGPLGIDLPVRPVRGQMIELAGTPGLVDVLLVRDHIYLVPRADGTLLVGSTVEEAGFDKSVTAAASDALRRMAVAMVPATHDMTMTGHWSGLRPGSPDGLPMIGAWPGLKGLWLNAGHFRNGITLAAGSADLLCAQATGASPALDPSPYCPGRD